jgi:hypothetical protein
MKNLILTAVMVVMAGSSYAADFTGLQGMKAGNMAAAETLAAPEAKAQAVPLNKLDARTLAEIIRNCQYPGASVQAMEIQGKVYVSLSKGRSSMVVLFDPAQAQVRAVGPAGGPTYSWTEYKKLDADTISSFTFVLNLDANGMIARMFGSANVTNPETHFMVSTDIELGKTLAELRE